MIHHFCNDVYSKGLTMSTSVIDRPLNGDNEKDSGGYQWQYGAASVGAEAKLIQLAYLNFNGCRSCFDFKSLQNPAPGYALNDDLSI